VYLWDLDDDPSAGGKEFAFAGAVVLKKGESGSIESITLVELLLRQSLGAAGSTGGSGAHPERKLGLAPCVRMRRERPFGQIQAHVDGDARAEHGHARQDGDQGAGRGRAEGEGGCYAQWEHDQTGERSSM